MMFEVKDNDFLHQTELYHQQLFFSMYPEDEDERKKKIKLIFKEKKKSNEPKRKDERCICQRDYKELQKVIEKLYLKRRYVPKTMNR